MWWAVCGIGAPLGRPHAGFRAYALNGSQGGARMRTYLPKKPLPLSQKHHPLSALNAPLVYIGHHAHDGGSARAGQTLQHVSIQMVNSAWARDVRWACSRAGWTGIPPHPQTPGSQAACSDVPVCGNWRLNPPALYPALGAGIVYLGACMDASPSTVNPVRPGPTTLPRQLSVSNRTGVRFTPHYIVAADGCPRSTVMGRSRGPPTPRVRLGAVERSTRATRL